jgi:hypothetical protein
MITGLEAERLQGGKTGANRKGEEESRLEKNLTFLGERNILALYLKKLTGIEDFDDQTNRG